ncbi:hypothetical protein [Mycolicibacterium sp.]|uniref:hypothetical protein n=1 Tax=Mycolicibacterium sp. TaxID=2320850 RepID=UPI001A2551C1|nr:hypothetical protein [Mycolicibacterium sp.]MBJ7339776.1 hypothetical protein [Mycolicibacterium sp.]
MKFARRHSTVATIVDLSTDVTTPSAWMRPCDWSSSHVATTMPCPARKPSMPAGTESDGVSMISVTATALPGSIRQNFFTTVDTQALP